MSSPSDRVVLPSAVTPVHYALILSPDLTALTFACDQSVQVLVSDADTTFITMHAKEIAIQTAVFRSSDGTSAEITAVEISYHLVDHTVTLKFDTALPLGEGTLRMAFTGILNSDMAGFYKSSYTDADGNKKVMASTQFEALDARRAFPCWDEPAVKATFSVTLIVPNNITALSNMPELSTEHLKGGRKKVVFETSPKMSTYLLAWAVGEFDFVRAVTRNGVKIAIYSPPGRAEQGRFALDVGVRALDFYDEFFGVPYPLPKLDMLCVTEFAMGAMENWGLVTYREVDLMIDAAKASSQQKQRVAIVVTHELAHQWFGNLVTMQWWDDLWLNEGFASFMEHYCTDALFPDWKVWEQYTTDAMGHALRLDALKSSHPIQVPIRRAEEVEQVFDAISYCKGSTVVRMACCVLGQDKFREGLRTYMARHKFGNTTTSDLWQAWSDVSGLDVGAIMESWTQKMGYPYLTVVSETWTAASVQLELEQNWFLADGTKDENSTSLWSIPVLFSTSKATSGAAVLMQGKRQTFNVPLSHAGDWVKINAGQQALVRVAYTPEMTKRLAVGAIRAGQLSVSDRAAVLLDAYALAKAGLAPVSTVAQLLTCYDQELNSTVWDAISGVLSGLNLLLEEEGGQTHEEFTEFAGKMVKTALDKVGWDAKEGDGHQEKLLRSTIIGLLGNFCWKDNVVSSEARRRYEAHWTDPSALSSDYKSTVYKIVLKHGGEKEYDAILKSFYATEDNSEKKYAMHTLGAASQVHLKQRTLEWAVKSGDVKLQDFFYPIGAVASSAAGAAQAWSYFQENFEYIKSKLSKASPSLMDAVIGNSISRFCTKRRADEIEAYFKAHPLPSSERRISQIVESIRTNGAMLDLVSASVIAKPGFWTGENGSLYFK